MFFILKYVLYKSRSLTLVTMIYSWDICCKYNAGAQGVIFTRYSLYETLCGHCVYWDRLYIGIVFG